MDRSINLIIEKRALLLEQLNIMFARQWLLHKELFDLVSEELALSHHIIASRSMEDSASLKELVFKRNVEFHQRADVIMSNSELSIRSSHT